MNFFYGTNYRINKVTLELFCVFPKIATSKKCGFRHISKISSRRERLLFSSNFRDNGRRFKSILRTYGYKTVFWIRPQKTKVPYHSRSCTIEIARSCPKAIMIIAEQWPNTDKSVVSILLKFSGFL